MIRSLASLLLLFAVLLAPFAMLGSAAMAVPPATAAMAAGHCEGMAPAAPKDDPGRTIDCMMICSTVLPSVPTGAGAHVAMAPLSPVPVPLRAFRGIEPVMELPPPRAA